MATPREFMTLLEKRIARDRVAAALEARGEEWRRVVSENYVDRLCCLRVKHAERERNLVRVGETAKELREQFQFLWQLSLEVGRMEYAAVGKRLQESRREGRGLYDRTDCSPNPHGERGWFTNL